MKPLFTAGTLLVEGGLSAAFSFKARYTTYNCCYLKATLPVSTQKPLLSKRRITMRLFEII